MLTTINTTADVRRELQHIEHRLAELTAEQQLLESHRDTLLRELVDADGAHDRRYVPVR